MVSIRYLKYSNKNYWNSIDSDTRQFFEISKNRNPIVLPTIVFNLLSKNEYVKSRSLIQLHKNSLKNYSLIFRE